MNNAKPATDAPVAVAFEDVSVRINSVLILEGVTAAAPRGGCTAVVGPNGFHSRETFGLVMTG